MDIVAAIAAGIKRMEGWAPGTAAYRNNNPGNLRPIAGGWPGQTGVDSHGLAIFGSLADGEAALESQIRTNIGRGLTLSEFFGGRGKPGDPGYYPGYAPAADSNQPNVYTSNLATWTGIAPDVPLSSLGVDQNPLPASPDLITAGLAIPSGDISPALAAAIAAGGVAAVYLIARLLF